MAKVPRNKTVYAGKRKYCEGEELPPFVMIDLPVLTKKQVEKIVIADERPKPKSSRKNKPKRFDF